MGAYLANRCNLYKKVVLVVGRVVVEVGADDLARVLALGGHVAGQELDEALRVALVQEVEVQAVLEGLWGGNKGRGGGEDKFENETRYLYMCVWGGWVGGEVCVERRNMRIRYSIFIRSTSKDCVKEGGAYYRTWILTLSM